MTKTFEQCCDEVARKKKYESMNDMVSMVSMMFKNSGKLIHDTYAEAAELYAQELLIEREVLIQAFSQVTKEFEGREWLMQGRGAYPYDDERYKEEVKYLMDSFQMIKQTMWGVIKSTTIGAMEIYAKELVKKVVGKQELTEAIEQAYMAGYHSCCKRDPSASDALAYRQGLVNDTTEQPMSKNDQSGRTCLTMAEKIEAMSLKYYSKLEWKPKKGDYYTTHRHDLELYRIVDEDNENLYTVYCHVPDCERSVWRKDEFLKGFGENRVWVPPFVLNPDDRKA